MHTVLLLRIPLFHGGHFPLFASSMKGVPCTALSGPAPIVAPRTMPLAQSGKCPLHDRFGRAADET